MRTLFIGDLHGCAAEFAALLATLDCRPSRDYLLLTGDAFSRGPDPLGVWEQIRAHRAAMVMGNHEARLLKQLQARRDGQPPKVKWPDQQYTLEQLEPVWEEVCDWLADLPLFIETVDFVLVHAGINPEKGLAGTSRDEFLAIRTWPPAKGITGLRWHDFYQPGGKLLVFGHDAPGGLVLKRRPDGRPYLVGLDSGCIYGKELSAYILEEERLVQVPASQQEGSRWLAGNDA
ncbi:MAG: metallophosphoesterase [Candidatus Latescibacteria bacterium]|nr:metallophosphoesterase [Candidatus Latescibacterota bacterium]